MQLALPRTNRGAFILAAPIVAAIGAVLLLLEPDSAALVVDSVVPIISTVVAVLSAALYWTNKKTSFRRIGLPFVATFSLFALGWILYTVQDRFMEGISTVAYADYAWLAGYFIFAMVLLMVAMGRKIELSKGIILVEGIYGALAVSFVTYSVYISVGAGSTPFETVVYGLYPILDVPILGLLIMLMWYYRKGQLEDYWFFITVAASFWMAGDVVYLVEAAADTYVTGSLSDVLFLINYSLLAIGFGLLVLGRSVFTSDAPASATQPKGYGKVARLEPRRAYLAWEPKSDRGMDIMVDNLRSGLEGLIISRRAPEQIAAQYGLKRTQMLWLSTATGSHGIHPSNLGIMTDTVVRFIENGKNTVVFFDGFESLCTYNDFRKALQVLDHMKDLVAAGSSRLVVSIDRRTLSDKEAALVEIGTMRV